tara:strand:+ start:18564 stop:18731 length:168 start_codon:yes stop_codon:yes gene_type:complete
MDELKKQIEILSEKWQSEIEKLETENKKLLKEILELKDVLLTFEKVCKKIRVQDT